MSMTAENRIQTAQPDALADFIAENPIHQQWHDDFYRWMHQHPELSGEEHDTAEKIREALSNFSADVTSNIGGYGITAVWENGPGPTILMRADFDALPVQEDSASEFPSLNEGKMHACGHDIHTTALMALCEYMDTHKDNWSGTFIALFQPSEENTMGATRMVEDNLTSHIPRPDVCLGQHVVAGLENTVMSAPGPVLAACDTITVTLYGKSAHASQPYAAIDPTYLAALIVVRLQGIVGREIPADDFAVVSVGTLSAGHTNNTIPGTATVVLNCRFYDDDIKEKTYRAIERVINAECQASNTPQPAKIVYSAHGELTDNDETVFEQVRPSFDAVFGDRSITADPWTASEDFPMIPLAFQAPYLFWTIGVTPEQTWSKRETYPDDIPSNHMPDFFPAPGVVNTVSTAAATAVLTYLFKG